MSERVSGLLGFCIDLLSLSLSLAVSVSPSLSRSLCMSLSLSTSAYQVIIHTHIFIKHLISSVSDWNPNSQPKTVQALERELCISHVF